MDIISEELEKYIQDHTTPESAVLAELNRETYVKVMSPQMLSGHVQGKFLEFISILVQPRRILEVGTFTGYSGICLARGLRPDGRITTIDINEELKPMVERYIAMSGMQDVFDLRTGKALDIIAKLDEVFDLVFIDADKINYCNYFDAVIDKVAPGGWILADNVLRKGNVVLEQMDRDTEALDRYNKKIQADSRVENMILSMRDGISIARKIG